MQFLIFLALIFVIQPVVEYWLHRLAHRFKVNTHVSHHSMYKGKQYSTYAGHAFAWCIIIGLLAFKRWLIALAVLKYEVIHTLSHCPGHYMYRHHYMHHHNPHCNFGVSAVWPDSLFCTLKYN